ncbi:helix-turn-helix domain-containing protein, partial [Escherichia coli]|uniref:helix-turn-helix domain-containing protein n=1 Tax=Escherichia coli TaxID=562 RepID=UPI000A94AE88
MDIFISKKMRNFILLAQTNNIARAAEKIHMTASPFGKSIAALGNDSNLLIVFYVQIMPDD